MSIPRTSPRRPAPPHDPTRTRFAHRLERPSGGERRAEPDLVHPQRAPHLAARWRPANASRREICTSSRASYALVLAAAVLWGLSGVVTKGILDTGLGSFEIAFWRLLLGGCLFALHAGWRNDLKLGSPSDLGTLAAFALVAVALHYVVFNLAIERGGVSLVNLFLASVPVLVALAAWLFLGERLTPWTAALGVLSALGLALVASGAGHGVEANLVSVGAALTVALTVVAYTVVGKKLLRRYSPLTLNAFVLPVGALMLLPFVTFDAKTPTVWLLLGLLTIFPTYLAHLFFQLGLKNVETSRVALLVNVEAVTALATAALLFGERLTAPGLLGVVLILVVSALVVLPRPPTVRTSREKRSILTGALLALRREGERIE